MGVGHGMGPKDASGGLSTGRPSTRADRGSWTPTPFRGHGLEPCASTGFRQIGLRLENPARHGPESHERRGDYEEREAHQYERPPDDHSRRGTDDPHGGGIVRYRAAPRQLSARLSGLVTP